MKMEYKMHGIVAEIGEAYSNSGGDFDVLGLIENSRKQLGLDCGEVAYLKSRFAAVIQSQKRARGEAEW